MSKPVKRNILMEREKTLYKINYEKYETSVTCKQVIQLQT